MDGWKQWQAAEQESHDLARLVNSFGLRHEEMATDWYDNDREKKLNMVLAWIAIVTVMPDWMMDGRNEASVLRMRKIGNLISDNELYKEYSEMFPDPSKIERIMFNREGMTPKEYAAAVAHNITREHKTLQQSLAGVAMRFLRKFDWFPEKEAQELMKFGNWYSFPLV